VEGAVIAALFFTVFGGLLFFSGLSALRRPTDDSISVGEVIAYQLTGEEPSLKPRWLKIFERVSHVVLLVLGGMLLTAGISGFFLE
jgi:hypothetical protein